MKQTVLGYPPGARWGLCAETPEKPVLSPSAETLPAAAAVFSRCVPGTEAVPETCLGAGRCPLDPPWPGCIGLVALPAHPSRAFSLQLLPWKLEPGPWQRHGAVEMEKDLQNLEFFSLQLVNNVASKVSQHTVSVGIKYGSHWPPSAHGELEIYLVSNI